MSDAPPTLMVHSCLKFTGEFELLWQEERCQNSLSVVLVGALVATAGYCGKLITEAITKHSDIVQSRKSRLVSLQSYLLAGQNVYLSQMGLVGALCEYLSAKLPSAYRNAGYDEILAQGYQANIMSDKDKLNSWINQILYHQCNLSAKRLFD